MLCEFSAVVILGKSAHGRERIQKIKASYGSVDLHYRLLAKRPLLQYATKNYFAYTIEAEKKQPKTKNKQCHPCWFYLRVFLHCILLRMIEEK